MLEPWYYLLALLASLAGMGTLDWQHKLALWHDRRRTLLTIGIGVMIFVAWDIGGIVLGIFFHGDSKYALPYRIAPEFPIEELLFLTLLCYVTLVLFRLGEKIWQRT